MKGLLTKMRSTRTLAADGSTAMAMADAADESTHSLSKGYSARAYDSMFEVEDSSSLSLSLLDLDMDQKARAALLSQRSAGNNTTTSTTTKSKSKVSGAMGRFAFKRNKQGSRSSGLDSSNHSTSSKGNSTNKKSKALKVALHSSIQNWSAKAQRIMKSTSVGSRNNSANLEDVLDYDHTNDDSDDDDDDGSLAPIELVENSPVANRPKGKDDDPMSPSALESKSHLQLDFGALNSSNHGPNNHGNNNNNLDELGVAQVGGRPVNSKQHLHQTKRLDARRGRSPRMSPRHRSRKTVGSSNSRARNNHSPPPPPPPLCSPPGESRQRSHSPPGSPPLATSTSGRGRSPRTTGNRKTNGNLSPPPPLGSPSGMRRIRRRSTSRPRKPADAPGRSAPAPQSPPRRNRRRAGSLSPPSTRMCDITSSKAATTLSDNSGKSSDSFLQNNTSFSNSLGSMTSLDWSSSSPNNSQSNVLGNNSSNANNNSSSNGSFRNNSSRRRGSSTGRSRKSKGRKTTSSSSTASGSPRRRNRRRVGSKREDESAASRSMPHHPPSPRKLARRRRLRMEDRSASCSDLSLFDP